MLKEASRSCRRADRRGGKATEQYGGQVEGDGVKIKVLNQDYLWGEVVYNWFFSLCCHPA